MSPVFRKASPEEYRLLARILCNAFLPIWNHNWFHGVSSPLDAVPLNTSTATLTPAQRWRIHFYHSLLKLTRLVGGTVYVLQVPASDISTDTSNSPNLTTADGAIDIGGILLWNPPHKRLPTFPFDVPLLYKSGFLSLLSPAAYGPLGYHRISTVFEANIHSLLSTALPRYGIETEADCGFVQMVAINPSFAGRRYARMLLQWRMEAHWEECGASRAPVILDTTTEEAVEVYEGLGFQVAGEKDVETGTDKMGIKKQSLMEQERVEARRRCRQRVMIALPPSGRKGDVDT